MYNNNQEFIVSKRYCYVCNCCNHCIDTRILQHTFTYNDVGLSLNCHHLDSPNTTSAITYRIKVRTNNSSASFVYGLAGKDSLTLIEIAG